MDAADDIRGREADAQRLSDRLMMELVGEPTAALSRDELTEAVTRAWLMGATFALNTVLGRDPCRICGATHHPGWTWAEPDLCTHCAVAVLVDLTGEAQ